MPRKSLILENDVLAARHNKSKNLQGDAERAPVAVPKK
jgi:hypothetical protein